MMMMNSLEEEHEFICVVPNVVITLHTGSFKKLKIGLIVKRGS